VDRFVPKPMAADPTQRVGKTRSTFLSSWLSDSNLSREEPRVENLHITAGHDSDRTIVLTVTLPLSPGIDSVPTIV